jgi:hypothetical protein
VFDTLMTVSHVGQEAAAVVFRIGNHAGGAWRTLGRSVVCSVPRQVCATKHAAHVGHLAVIAAELALSHLVASAGR